MHTTRIAALIASLAVGFAATAASAAEPVTVFGKFETKTTTVTLSGLDLSTEEGASSALGRIRMASRQVCDSYAANATRDMTLRRATRECEAVATARAVDSMNAPMVAALHRKEGGITQIAVLRPDPSTAR